MLAQGDTWTIGSSRAGINPAPTERVGGPFVGAGFTPARFGCRRLSIAQLGFSLPEEKPISLRITTNIEQLEDEFERRTRFLEIAVNDRASSTLPAFICLEMVVAGGHGPRRK